MYDVTADERFTISPQAWGCTAWRILSCNRAGNLPTSVGMYRARVCACWSILQSPHKRGDVPAQSATRSPWAGISPQAWGCTARLGTERFREWNLPTSVGMYRRGSMAVNQYEESPHKRGMYRGNR